MHLSSRRNICHLLDIGEKWLIPQNSSTVVTYAIPHLTNVITVVASHYFSLRWRKRIMTSASYQATITLIANRVESSLFAASNMTIYELILDAFLRYMMDLAKDKYAQSEFRRIIEYRQRRNEILLDAVSDRCDWNVIVHNIINTYLDDYMQNEDMCKIKLTDAFAVRKLRFSEIDYYLDADLTFCELV